MLPRHPFLRRRRQRGVSVGDSVAKSDGCSGEEALDLPRGQALIHLEFAFNASLEQRIKPGRITDFP